MVISPGPDRTRSCAVWWSRPTMCGHALQARSTLVRRSWPRFNRSQHSIARLDQPCRTPFGFCRSHPGGTLMSLASGAFVYFLLRARGADGSHILGSLFQRRNAGARCASSAACTRRARS